MAGEAEEVLNNLISNTVKERLSSASTSVKGVSNDSPVIDGETCRFYFNGPASAEEVAKFCTALGIKRTDLDFIPPKSIYARQQYTISREALSAALNLPSEMELSIQMGIDEAKGRFTSILNRFSPERSPRSERRSPMSDTSSHESTESSKYSIPDDESAAGSEREEKVEASVNADDETIKAALKEAFRHKFMAQYKSKSRHKDGKDVHEELPEAFQKEPLDVFFESYYQKMMSGLSRDSKESMRKQLIVDGQIQKQKILKLAEDMSRSLVGVVGDIAHNQTSISNDILVKAATSLKTDLSTTIDIVNIYQKDLKSIFKVADGATFNLADAIVNKIKPNIEKPEGNLNYNSILGLIGFGVIIGVSSELLSRNKLDQKQLENFINAYVNIVTGMVSEFEKAGVPFLEKGKDPKNSKLLINNDVLNELLNASAAVAIRFVNQPVPNEAPALRSLGSDLTKAVTNNPAFSKYKGGFFQAGGFPNHYTNKEGYAVAKAEIQHAVVSAKDHILPPPAAVGWAHKQESPRVSPVKEPQQNVPVDPDHRRGFGKK